MVRNRIRFRVGKRRKEVTGPHRRGRSRETLTLGKEEGTKILKALASSSTPKKRKTS